MTVRNLNSRPVWAKKIKQRRNGFLLVITKQGMRIIHVSEIVK